MYSNPLGVNEILPATSPVNEILSAKSPLPTPALPLSKVPTGKASLYTIVFYTFLKTNQRWEVSSFVTVTHKVKISLVVLGFFLILQF